MWHTLHASLSSMLLWSMPCQTSPQMRACNRTVCRLQDGSIKVGLGNKLLDATLAAANNYANALEALSGRAAGSGLDRKLTMAADGQSPDGLSCIDYHAKCSDWASQVTSFSCRNLPYAWDFLVRLMSCGRPRAITHAAQGQSRP